MICYKSVIKFGVITLATSLMTISGIMSEHIVFAKEESIMQDEQSMIDEESTDIQTEDYFYSMDENILENNEDITAQNFQEHVIAESEDVTIINIEEVNQNDNEGINQDDIILDLEDEDTIFNYVHNAGFEEEDRSMWSIDGEGLEYVENEETANSGVVALRYTASCATSYTISQTISGLEKGNYAYEINMQGESQEIFIKAVADGKEYLEKVLLSGSGIWDIPYIEDIQVEEGDTITISIFINATEGEWGIIDDIGLYKKEVEPEPEPSVPSDKEHQTIVPPDNNKGNVQDIINQEIATTTETITNEESYKKHSKKSENNNKKTLPVEASYVTLEGKKVTGMKNVIHEIISETQNMNPRVPLATGNDMIKENRLNVTLNLTGVTSQQIAMESILEMRKSEADFEINLSDKQTILLSHEDLVEVAKHNCGLDLTTTVSETKILSGINTTIFKINNNVTNEIPCEMIYNIGKEYCGKVVYAFGKQNGIMMLNGTYIVNQNGQIMYMVKHLEDQVLMY